MNNSTTNKTINTKKLFVIDINPSNDEVTRELVMGKLASSIKTASINNTVAIVSHSNLELLKKMISYVGLKSGYIISDAGARIYSIEKEMVIYNKPILKEDVDTIAHHLIMLGLLVLASSDKKEYAYSIDVMNVIALQKRHYISFQSTSEFIKFNKFLKNSTIYSFVCFSKNRLTMLEKYEDLIKVSDDFYASIKVYQGSYFVISNKDATKYNSIIKTMEFEEITSMEQVHYYSLNTLDQECSSAFKNSYISNEVIFAKEMSSNQLYSRQTSLEKLPLLILNEIAKNSKNFNSRKILKSYQEKTDSKK